MMEGLKEKVERTSGESLEEGFSPEKKETFEFLIDKAIGQFFYFDNQFNWDKFLKEWESYSLLSKREILETRKVWLEMKKNGDAFNQFLINKILESLDKNINLCGSVFGVYSGLKVYIGLNGYINHSFFAEILDNKAVWSDMDASTAGMLLSALEMSKNQDSVDAVKRFIEHALSTEYKRQDYLDGDLKEAVRSLINIQGFDKTKVLINELAEKDLTLRGWLERHKLAANNIWVYDYGDEKLLIPDDFDAELEITRINDLETEVEELEKNSPSTEKYETSISGFKFVFDDLDYDDSGDLDVYNNIDTHENLYDDTKFDYNAASWEVGKLLNFYGRFKPKFEKPVGITLDNYVDSILATLNNSQKISDPDNYLRILSGAIDQMDIIKEGDKLEFMKTAEEAYRVTAVVFARALSVGILENRVDDAVFEIKKIKDFIVSSAEKNEDSNNIDFLLSLADQLGQLQRYLLQSKSVTSTEELSETASSFLVTHPSMNRVHEVASFRELLAEKIRWYIANDLAQNLQSIKFEVEVSETGEEKIVPISGPSFDRLKSIFDEYKNGLELYKDVEKNDVPIYLEAKESLVRDFDSKRNVVFGRDGRYFFTALKASELGQRRTIQKYVVVTSPMISFLESKKIIADYLRQNGVTLDYNFIDTGYNGTIPEFAIEALADADNTHLSKDDVDSKIKLLCSSHDGRAQIIKNRNIYFENSNYVGIIEDRPKSVDRPNNLVVGKDGRIRPQITPNSVKEQLQAWVVEHVSFRNFIPKLDYNHLPIELKISTEILERLKQKGLVLEQTPEKALDEVLAEADIKSGSQEYVAEEKEQKTRVENRKSKFESFINKHLDDVKEEKRVELLNDTVRLYEVSKEKIAPVVVDFAKWCLEKVKPGQKVLFLARDGLAPWIAARLLIRQGQFPNITEDQLKYAHLSRKITWQESGDKLKKYLSQLGIDDDDEDMLTVDIGMFGAIHSALRDLYPRKKVKSLYLISATHDEGVEGYLSDIKKGTSSIDPIWKSISGNPAVHFLEDTFSGFYSSTQSLVESEDGKIKPKIGIPYSREVYLKRLAAIDGIVDCVLAKEKKDPKDNSDNLNLYLSSQFNEDKKYIMVPHE